MADDALTDAMTVGRARPLRGATTEGSIELVPGSEILDTVQPIYARDDRRPGRIARPGWLWGRYFENAITGHSA